MAPVNVVSAKHPANDEWQDFDSENIVKGKWNVMSVRRGHHGSVIGMDGDTDETHKFYTDHFGIIDGMPRDRKYYFKGLF